MGRHSGVSVDPGKADPHGVGLCTPRQFSPSVNSSQVRHEVASMAAGEAVTDSTFHLRAARIAVWRSSIGTAYGHRPAHHGWRPLVGGSRVCRGTLPHRRLNKITPR
jgi:hypothetical protein